MFFNYWQTMTFFSRTAFVVVFVCATATARFDQPKAKEKLVQLTIKLEESGNILFTLQNNSKEDVVLTYNQLPFESVVLLVADGMAEKDKYCYGQFISPIYEKKVLAIKPGQKTESRVNYESFISKNNNHNYKLSAKLQIGNNTIESGKIDLP